MPANGSNFNITGNDLYDLFGKYGPIRQIRIGSDGANLKTKGTAYIVYESPDDAKEAMGKLNGFHLMERYIVGESCCGPLSCIRYTYIGGHPLRSRGKAVCIS